MTASITRFKVGQTYWTRSACDSDCIFRFEVVARTEKTISLRTAQGVKRCKVYERQGEEACLPLGRYSMAPVISAGRQG